MSCDSQVSSVSVAVIEFVIRGFAALLGMSLARVKRNVGYWFNNEVLHDQAIKPLSSEPVEDREALPFWTIFHEGAYMVDTLRGLRGKWGSTGNGLRKLETVSPLAAVNRG